MAKTTQVLHISAECYPAAKIGGLADVVGSLPKYLGPLGVDSPVIIPKYHLPWILKQSYKEVHRGTFQLGYYSQPYVIEKQKGTELGFPLYVVDLPGKFDRPGIYADPSGHHYGDEPERYLAFQRAVLAWVQSWKKKPDILHCHDHHTGLIPFMIRHSPDYADLSGIATVFTIHNGRYHGAFGWDRLHLLPFFDGAARGLIDWGGAINPLAAAIKTCWTLTTVSYNYLQELKVDSNGLEWLYHEESPKSVGILNGIDNEVWDPASDERISFQLKKSIPYFKRANKKTLLQSFGLDKKLPLVAFIGRFAREKGADLLPDLIYQTLINNFGVNLLVLGSGNPMLEDALNGLKPLFPKRYNTYIGYSEDLAHQIYAGADFLLMPSRVEPCGLNQMYAMRYGTLPIVRRTGGLVDSVTDIGDPGGCGIMFNHVLVGDILHAFSRAIDLYSDKSAFQAFQENVMQLDFSWQRSAQEYLKVYTSVKND